MSLRANQHQLEVPEAIDLDWLTTANKWYYGEKWSVIATVSGWLIRELQQPEMPTDGAKSLDIRGELVGFGIVPKTETSLRNVMILGSAALYTPDKDLEPINPGGTVLVDLNEHLIFNPVLLPATDSRDGYEQQVFRWLS